MSGSNSTVSLTLQIRGQQAAQEMKRISDQQVQATTKINTQWTQIGSAQAKFVNTARAGTRETLNTARAGDQLLRTNKLLEGVLRQQGALLKQQVGSAQQLANWAKQVEQSSKRTHQSTRETMSLWQKGTAVAGGAMAGGMYISNALQKPRDYDQQLTYIAATATGGQGMTPEARLAARSQLNEYIKAAVRGGGGTREDAAEAANTLIASGKYELNNVAPALNTAVKTAFATGASATDAASLTTRMQEFGLTDLQRGHDIAVRGGQLGSFEYKDQAKWLAQQMGLARAAGYSGERGFVELVAMNQIAMKTAATPDAAGNNMVGLLQKLSSAEFSKAIADAVKTKKGDPTKSDGKKKPSQVFDWSTYAIQQREQGVYGVEAFVKLLERQLAGNAQYTKLQKQAASSDSAARKAALEDMSNIAMGSEIGNIIADQQALMAALSVVYNKDTLNDLRKQLPNASGTVAADFDMVSRTEWAKDQAMNQEKLFAQSKAYDAISESLGGLKDTITKSAAENENLAGVTYGAAVAVGGLALAAGAAAFTLKTMGGIKTPDLPSTTGGLASKASNAAKTAGLVGAAYTGYQIFKPIDDAGYSMVSDLLAKVGIGSGGERPDFVQQAIEQSKAQQASAEEKSSQLIAEQQKQNQLSQEMINKINTLINVTGQNKTINFSGGLLGAISENAAAEEKRHGASNVPFYLQRH
ncbi:phage tail tape measure protein [Acinetobacter baumannii]|uniref:phage tail tape measure protein n=1 Tax=Acinetobacter baumannii TaxID=470 RepID=UPI000B408463|nr:phage tail tape measure protein [Acinetobacter baumannii]EHZ7970020.1 phage tail tape measure protein [Acinetobacter baumannii]EKU4294494.1 phage tail tape measure protein [Acinetobacter baumannii]EKU4349022.1 phage tail tape measure protein [Acinetobacter baumannii]EKU7976481.1 phage tail tape measure protein [Acinetobacter baumannii]EKV6376451.1 phage tail tape measure protein [Acinetobacter baumannii]